jgi:hypothetical protein
MYTMNLQPETKWVDSLCLKNVELSEPSHQQALPSTIPIVFSVSAIAEIAEPKRWRQRPGLELDGKFLATSRLCVGGTTPRHSMARKRAATGAAAAAKRRRGGGGAGAALQRFQSRYESPDFRLLRDKYASFAKQ